MCILSKIKSWCSFFPITSYFPGNIHSSPKSLFFLNKKCMASIHSFGGTLIFKTNFSPLNIQVIQLLYWLQPMGKWLEKSQQKLNALKFSSVSIWTFETKIGSFTTPPPLAPFMLYKEDHTLNAVTRILRERGKKEWREHSVFHRSIEGLRVGGMLKRGASSVVSLKEMHCRYFYVSLRLSPCHTR